MGRTRRLWAMPSASASSVRTASGVTDLGADGFLARPTQLLTQRHFLGRLNSNGGIESIELLPPTAADGEPRILAITEDTLDPRGNIKAFIADGHDISWFAVQPREPYKPTDMARLPNGDLLLLSAASRCWPVSACRCV